MTRRVWTPEEQKDINRTIRAVALCGVLDWENRIAELEKPGQRKIEPPLDAEEKSDG